MTQRIHQFRVVPDRDEQSIDAVEDLLPEGPHVGRQHRKSVATREQDVLGGRRRAVGQGQDVMAGHEFGDAICRHIAAVDLDPVTEALFEGELLDPSTGIPPHLPGDRDPQVRHLPDRLEEKVHTLVVTNNPQRQEAGGSVGIDMGDPGPSRKVGWEVELADVVGAEVGGHPCLFVTVHDHGVHSGEEGLHQRTVTGPGLVRQHVVGDRDRAGRRVEPSVGAHPPSDSRGAQQRQMGWHHGRDHVDDDDGIHVAQASSSTQPGVRSRPREHPERPREGLNIGSPARDGGLAGVEQARIEVTP